MSQVMAAALEEAAQLGLVPRAEAPPRGSIVPILTHVVVVALSVDVDVVALLRGPDIYTNIPPNLPPPFLEVLGGEEVPDAMSLKRSEGVSADVLVRASSTQRGTAEVDTLIGACIVALRDRVLPLNPWPNVLPLIFVANQPPVQLLVDGVPWRQRTCIFRVRAR